MFFQCDFQCHILIVLVLAVDGGDETEPICTKILCSVMKLHQNAQGVKVLYNWYMAGENK